MVACPISLFRHFAVLRSLILATTLLWAVPALGQSGGAAPDGNGGAAADGGGGGGQGGSGGAAPKAAVEPPETPWRVMVAGSPPFVIDDGGELTGMSIDVWRALARRADIRYELVPTDDVDGALKAVAAGKADAAIGPLSITAKRATSVAFTQPYFQSRLAIASRSVSPTLWDRLAPFATLTFAGAVGTVFLVLALVGVLLWLAERRHNDQFPEEPLPGIGNGIWLAVVTMTTVGYGDRAPTTILGKVICGVWMVVAVLSATSLLAGIASALTVSGLQSSHVATADDMKGAKVAAVTGPAAQLARSHGAKLVTVENLEEGLEKLSIGAVDAVVFDEPQLRYRMPGDSELTISDATYHPQGYGFVLPIDAESASQLNVALLHAAEDGEIRSARQKWLPGVAD